MTQLNSTFHIRALAGFDFDYSVKRDDYPVDKWQLSAVIRGPMAIDLVAAVQGESFVFSAPASTTTTWLPGEYWYSLRATNGTAVREMDSGRMTVSPDLAAMTEPYDGRSPAELALASIEAVLAKRATQDQQRYTINGRELWRTPIPELLKLRTFYAVQVSRERASKSGKNRFGRPIYVKF
jgi:hypothetical protein